MVIQILKLLKLYLKESWSGLLFLKQASSFTYPRLFDLKVKDCAYKLKFRINLVLYFQITTDRLGLFF